MPRLRVHGGRVIDPVQNKDETVDLVVDNGRVSGYLASEAPGEFDLVIDATGLIVAPGFVDVHSHLREPGFEDKETIATGARAAVAGGFTTICCMPNTKPTLDTAADVAFVFAAGERAGMARVLPLGAVTRGQQGKELTDCWELADAGVVGFSDDGHPIWDAELMRYALVNSLRHRRPIVNHCEDPTIAAGGVMNEGRVSDLLGLKGQPGAAEEVMVARDIELARLTGGRLHLAHISTEGSVELLRKAKLDGLAVSAEVTPHHLALNDEWVRGNRTGPLGDPTNVFPFRGPYDTRTKVNPPLRSEHDRQALVAALSEGIIDVIATDHAPHRSIDKDCTYDEAAFGISGFETALGTLLRLNDAGGLSLPDLVRRLSPEPCRIFGMPYGNLGVGATADVVLFDPDVEWTVDASAFLSKGKNTPLDGQRLRGRVVTTLVAGEVVFERERL